jgi:hypothetical protein
MSIKRANISSIEHEIIRKLAIKSGQNDLSRRIPDEAGTATRSHLFRSRYISRGKSEWLMENLLDF